MGYSYNKFSKKRLNDFTIKQFNRFENRWGFTIYDTLGSEIGQEGEIEIVRYVDSLLKRDQWVLIINFKYHIKKEQLYHHIGFHRIKKVLINSEDSV